MHVRDLLDREVISLRRDDSIDHLVRVISETPQDVFPVVDDGGRVVGSVSEVELIAIVGPNRRTFAFGPRKIAREGLVRDVEDVMSPRPATVRPDEALESALRRMQALRLPQIVVADEDRRLVGLLRGRDAFCHLFGSTP